MSDDEEFTTTQGLVASTLAGDHAAREDLFRRYLPRVARMVANQLGVPRDELPASAEDVAQNAIVRALAGLPRFEMRGRGAFAAWLATIVENAVRSHYRRNTGQGARRFWQRYGDLDLTESFFPGAEPSPSGVVAGMESNRVVEAAMLRLPSLFRNVLALRFFADMSHAEVAAQIGRTEVNSPLRKA
ncbi:MAG: RNA polymerase sigma factor [Planctomycetota bacterium]